MALPNLHNTYQRHGAACREVFFETNGVPRMVEVEDRTSADAAAAGAGAAGGRPSREKADTGVLGSVGSPMSGDVIEIVAKPGNPSVQSYAAVHSSLPL